MDNIRIIPEYAKTKDDIWSEVFESLETPSGKKVFFRHLPIWAYAASFLIPVFLTGLFYTKTIETAKGEHTHFKLPDHSIIALNAESKASYNPFKWFFSRIVQLEGEAYFEVKHGNRFIVQSGINRVNVLGTKFNVYARSGVYSVTCLEGKVEVYAESGSIVLHSNMQATLRVPQFSIKNDVSTSIATGWMQGRFVFDETPLREVIAEIERQYNIKVVPMTYPNHPYSGNFFKTDEPGKLLEAIGTPFGIKFRIEE